jgi:hypothetical protein
MSHRTTYCGAYGRGGGADGAALADAGRGAGTARCKNHTLTGPTPDSDYLHPKPNH